MNSPDALLPESIYSCLSHASFVDSQRQPYPMLIALPNRLGCSLARPEGGWVSTPSVRVRGLEPLLEVQGWLRGP